MKKMFAVVFFLVVVTSVSSVSSASLNNDENEAIVMVVEEATSMHDAGTKMTKLQIGNFLLKDGKVLTLSRKSSPSRNSYCVDNLVDPCGAADWCCEGLSCTSYVRGTCKKKTGCAPKGYTCNMLMCCEWPSKCSGTGVDSICV